MTLQKVKIQAKDSRVFNYIYLAVYLREKWVRQRAEIMKEISEVEENRFRRH